jgi:two-component system sensor histidine kinase PilS (NtrC family)
MVAGINERTWQEWVVKVRIIIITVLLAIELALVDLTTTNVNRHLFLLVIFGWYASAALHLYLFLSGKSAGLAQSAGSGSRYSGSTYSKLQVLTDLCFTTAVIYVTGGIDTAFVFLYPILIIVASTLLSESWAYLTAGISFVLFGAMLELSYFGVIHSYSVTHPDLKTLQAIIVIYLVAFGAIAYLANKLVSRMRRAEGELEDKSCELENLQVLHQVIVRSISSGLLTTDLDGVIRLANPAAHALLGWAPEELTGRSVRQLFLDPLPVAFQPRREVRARTQSGAELLLGIGCSLLHGTEGSILGSIYTFTDLTEIRHLERELRQRDRLAALGRMASGIAHEIRNPLSSIAGSVQMLSSIATLSDDQRALLSIVTRESERLNAIISDFLTYSRDREFQSVRVDLCRLLSDTLTLLENEPSGVRIERRCNGHEEAFTEGDGNKLKQVFWNLSSNALRAMPAGGTLTVSLEAAGEDWRISFHDTGEGIPPQLLEKIFEPFQSGFEGGTGLGLAIVYRIVQAHKAKISVSSEPGQGTTFTLLFRQAGAASQPVASDAWLPQSSTASAPHSAYQPGPGRAQQESR